MIQFANKETKPLVRSMWKTVFGDGDEYMDLIFSKKYKDENTLIYFEGNKAVASLQMLPHTIRFYGKPVVFYYLAGLCTLSDYRGKGYMGELIRKSHQVMSVRNIPLSILVPAEKSLFGYYEKYGYVQTFEKGEQPINFDSVVKEYLDDRKQGFKVFDQNCQQGDFTVLKTEDDLQVIVEEYIQSQCPSKYNLGAMSRVIDALPLLQLYADKNPSLKFTVQVNDEQFKTAKQYEICNGKAQLVEAAIIPDFEADEKLLTRLLFGYKTKELPFGFVSFFGEYHPIINLMLE